MRTQSEWLLRELPRLVDAGVLDAAAAARLRAHYAVATVAQGRWGAVLFPLLGALLIGLGLVLLVAHNWDQLSRPLRLFVAFTPLLLGQLACAWSLLKAPQSRAWHESSSTFCALAFAAALALVGQIFHFPGDLDRYLLTCALLAVPLVYLLDASLLAVLCGLGFFGWAAAAPDRDAQVWTIFGLFALLGPHLWRLARREPDGLRLTLALAALVPLFFAATIAVFWDQARLALWWLAQFGGLLVVVDAQRIGPELSLRRPLAVYGGATSAVAALIGSFPDVWRDQFWTRHADQLAANWAFLAAGLALLVVLAWRAWQRGAHRLALQMLPAALFALAAGIDGRALAVLFALLMSAYVLVLGLATIRHGMQTRQSGLATRGLGLIALLVLLRFVDTEWSFTARGVAFVLCGATFIAVHLWLRRRIRT
ncbi:MAG: DUF2157 domain-containing protein [Sinimarinibacterium sp.]|jgi:hypothetical protein